MSRAFAIGAVMVFVSLPLLADDPLAGTWQQDRSRAQYDQRAPVVTYAPFENGGVRYSTEMGPVYAAPFDEQEHAVLGPNAATDKVKMKRLDKRTYEVTYYRDGRKYETERVEVRDHGKKLVRSVTVYPRHTTPTTDVYHYTRTSGEEAEAPFGSWTMDRSLTEYAPVQPLTIAAQPDGALQLTFGDGTSYTVKMDGSEAPVPDSAATVSARRIDEHTVELTYHNGGRVTNVVQLAADPDGKTMVVTTSPHLENGETRSSKLYFTRR